MSRWFLGNFEFEHQLAAPGFTPSRMLERISAELATSWLAIADDGDAIWTPEAIDDDFWIAAAAEGLSRVTGVRDQRLLDEATLVPWGWSAECIQAARERGALTPDFDVVRRANSRFWSTERELAWDIALPHTTIARSISDVEAAIDRMASEDQRWVIKAEFGMSGRERRLGRGLVSESDRHWIARRLAADGRVFVEPWVDAVAEAGVQFEIAPTKPPELVGVVEMLPTAGGQYAGTLFRNRSTGAEACDWEPAVRFGEQAAAELQRLGYFGPLGIDAMAYRRPDGAMACRPLQDINARWTMGRLAIGWRRRFPDAILGYWWHGSVSDFDAGQHLAVKDRYLPRDGNGVRVIRTSPERMGDRPCRHVSAVVLVEPSVCNG